MPAWMSRTGVVSAVQAVAWMREIIGSDIYEVDDRVGAEEALP